MHISKHASILKTINGFLFILRSKLCCFGKKKKKKVRDYQLQNAN